MRLVQIALLGLIVLLQYRFWFAENGYFENRQLERKLAEQQTILNTQQIKNDQLRARVIDLKSSNDAIEELARQDLGLIKPGEVFIMIVDE